MQRLDARLFRLLIRVAQWLPPAWRIALAESPKAAWLRRLSLAHGDSEAVVELSAPLAGCRMRLSTRAGHRRFALGTYEPDVCSVIRSRGRGETMLDIGANVGYFTLLMARQTGRSGHVVAFEPVPAIHAALRENLRLNGCHQVRAECLAVADVEADGMMQSEASGSMPFTAHISEAGDCPVSLVSVDGYVQRAGLQKLDFVKIDVEGAEDRVIRGMTRTLQNLRPDILLEIHRTDGAESEALGRLRAAGYRLTRVGRNGRIPSGTTARGGHIVAEWRGASN
jgi:FkbM family methyltransferase